MTDEMTPEEQEFLAEWKRKRRRRRRRILLIVGGIVLALIALLTLGALIYGWYWQAKLDAKVAELQAQGKLLTWQQVLDRDKDLPPGENSALVYLKAFGQLQDTPQTKVVPWLNGECAARPSPTAMDLLASAAQTDAQALATTLSVAALQESCYPLKAERGPWDLSLPHCEKARSAVRLCGQLAVFNAAAGRPAEAAQCVMGGFGLASSFGRKACPIENLVRIASDALAVAALERSLALCQFSVEDLGTLRVRLAREETDRSAAWGLAVNRSEIHHELTSGDETVAHMLPLRLRIIPGRRQRLDFVYQTTADEAERLAALPPRQALAEITAHQASMAGYPDLDIPMWGMYSRQLKAEVAAEVQLAVASAALAVEQYRLKNGRWPDSLDQLVPEFIDAVPEDYFGPGKIRYVGTEQGVTVYSVGEDGGDDGGATVDEAAKQARPDAYDLPIRLLDPELRGAQTMTFRDEVVRSAVSLKDLKAAGLDGEALKGLGLTEDDLRTLRSNR